MLKTHLSIPDCYYDWLIVGGGPQGLALAGALSYAGVLKTQSLAIVDAGPSPLWAWRRRALNCGMHRLRSDLRYHLDCWPQKVPYTLEDWAEAQGIHDQIQLLDAETQHRVPTIALFDAHCNWFITERGLAQFWRQGVVTRLEQSADIAAENDGRWLVHTQRGEVLATRNLVLATGQDELNFPQWAKAVQPVYHLLDLEDPSLPLPALFECSNYKHITIVGGGLSAAGFALRLKTRCEGDGPAVTILLHSPLRTSVLESDLATLEEPFQAQFKASDYGQRRFLIQEARMGGTIPPATYQDLVAAGIDIRLGVVKSATQTETICLKLNNERSLATDAVVLGTGFRRGGCSNKLVLQVAKDYGAQFSECGYPIPDPSLQWLPGLYLLGGLAELELGPVSRNLAGAGQGVERVMQTVLTPA